jgi:DNA-binding transcriptional MerR regulator
METFQIAELSRRTGFSRPTLRYYEEIGLLEEPRRSDAGYRIYGKEDEARLEFIRRSKRLGLSLDEIRDLVNVWAGGECTTTRRHVQQLLEQKVAAVREQIEECTTFLHQLELASGRLTAAPAGGDGCDCAPELPHVDLVQFGADLSIHETAACSCGGTCDEECGCACCGSTRSSTDRQYPTTERRDHHEHEPA